MKQMTELKEKGPADKSMFSDDAFEEMRKLFTENNPALANDRPKIATKIDNLEEEILQLLEKRSDDCRMSIQILMQTLNFFARFVGWYEFFSPDFEQDEPETWLPIERKHAAIFVADDKEGPFYNSIIQVFGGCMNQDVLKYKFYTSTRELLKDIIDGLIFGIAAFQLDQKSSIESHLRHDLKNMPGFNYESAKDYVLPVCIDFAPPHQIFEIISTLLDIRQGTYQSGIHTDKFSLSETLPILIAHMHVPKQKAKILIIDDIPDEILGMHIILKDWPNIECSVIHQSGKEPPHIPQDIDILLLDESMDSITGTDIANHLRSSDFPGLIVSITSGKKPDHADFHFGSKSTIYENQSMAKEFVRFTSSLLQRIEQVDQIRAEQKGPKRDQFGVEQKAPKGMFRVIGVDTFSGDSWLEGDFPDKGPACEAADKKGAEMTKMHVYDDQGNHLHDSGTF